MPWPKSTRPDTAAADRASGSLLTAIDIAESKPHSRLLILDQLVGTA